VYPHQLERLSAALHATGAAALVATSPANVRYVTGFGGAVSARDAGQPCLGVFSDSGTALIVPAGVTPAVAVDVPDVTAVACYGRLEVPGRADREDARRLHGWLAGSAAGPEEALQTALSRIGAGTERVALDEDGLTPGQWRRLQAQLGAARLADGGTEQLAVARAVKGPFEIECLDRALAFAEEALNEAIQMLKPGVTEREAALVCIQHLLTREVTPGPVHIVAGAGSALGGNAPSGRTLRTGDLVRCTVGGAYKGYHSRVVRTAVVGEPSPRQAEIHAALQAGVEHAIDALRPGTAIGHAAAGAGAAVRAAGLVSYAGVTSTHGIGLTAHEWPDLARAGDAIVEPGMVVVVELSHDELGWGGIGLADTALVTRTGAHTLNRSRRGLVFLD
jgi:Xaa-Pro aminopeptidase